MINMRLNDRAIAVVERRPFNFSARIKLNEIDGLKTASELLHINESKVANEQTFLTFFTSRCIAISGSVAGDGNSSTMRTTIDAWKCSGDCL